MGIFDSVTEVQVGKHVLQFRQPQLAEIERARALSTEFNAAPDAAMVDRILYTDIPQLIGPLLCGAVAEGVAELPADWRERVRQANILAGVDGVGLLRELCFRSWFPAFGEAAA